MNTFTISIMRAQKVRSVLLISKHEKAAVSKNYGLLVLNYTCTTAILPLRKKTCQNGDTERQLYNSMTLHRRKAILFLIQKLGVLDCWLALKRMQWVKRITKTMIIEVEVPSSPMNAMSDGTLLSMLLLASATAIAKSAAGSWILKPPMTFVCISILPLKFAYFLTIASIWLIRFLSIPFEVLIGGLSLPCIAQLTWDTFDLGTFQP